MIEFDNHAGVYLTNEEPANFHVHTLVRTPNGNDYVDGHRGTSRSPSRGSGGTERNGHCTNHGGVAAGPTAADRIRRNGLGICGDDLRFGFICHRLVGHTNLLEGSNPAQWHRVFWAFALAVLPITLMILDDLRAVKSAVLVVSLPLLVIGVTMCVSLFRTLERTAEQ